MSSKSLVACLLLPAAVLVVGCSGSGSGSSGSSGGVTTLPSDQGVAAPKTLQLTLSGFNTCSCFNGIFTLSQASGAPAGSVVWSSAAINSCPGQTKPAFLRVMDTDAGFSFGITDATSFPGSGDSDGSNATVVQDSPLSILGPGASNGNINNFCGGAEDEVMKWSAVECPDGLCAQTLSFPVPSCDGGNAPPTLTLTLSGSGCSCLDGTHTLTQYMSAPSASTDVVWASAPITTCPGQTETAFLKLDDSPANGVALGIASETSSPGNGDSDDAPALSLTCSTFAISGGGSHAGNINSFCPAGTDEAMTWSITP